MQTTGNAPARFITSIRRRLFQNSRSCDGPCAGREGRGRASISVGPGAISGSELEALTDRELKYRLPELHVFVRVSPQDKLRLARLMQEQGLIVAMTGDAVNDAAAFTALVELSRANVPAQADRAAAGDAA